MPFLNYWRGRNTVFLGYLATIMLPTQVAMIPLYIVFRRFGMAGTYLPLILCRPFSATRSTSFCCGYFS